MEFSVCLRVSLFTSCVLYFALSWSGLELLLRSSPYAQTTEICILATTMEQQLKTGLLLPKKLFRTLLALYRLPSTWLTSISCSRSVMSRWIASSTLGDKWMDTLRVELANRTFVPNAYVSLQNAARMEQNKTCAESLGHAEGMFDARTTALEMSLLLHEAAMLIVTFHTCMGMTWRSYVKKFAPEQQEFATSRIRWDQFFIMMVQILFAAACVLRFNDCLLAPGLAGVGWQEVFMSGLSAQMYGWLFCTTAVLAIALLVFVLEACIAPIMLTFAVMFAMAGEIGDNGIFRVALRCVAFLIVEATADKRFELSLPCTRSFDTDSCSSDECTICLMPLHTVAPEPSLYNTALSRRRPGFRTAASRNSARNVIVRLSQCRHAFHRECLDAFFSQFERHECPTCRTINERWVCRRSYPSLGQFIRLVSLFTTRTFPIFLSGGLTFALLLIMSNLVSDIPLRILDYLLLGGQICRK